MEKQDKKLELIAQLLAKAESTTPAEAEALTEHAERLMVKYQIDKAMLDAREDGEREREPIVHEHRTYTGVYAVVLHELAYRVAFALGTVHPLVANYKNAKTVYFNGFKSDVEQAWTLVDSLEIQAKLAMRTWWSKNKDNYTYASESARSKARRSHISGFVAGVSQRLTKIRDEAVLSTTGAELVLANRNEEIKDYLSETFGVLRKSRSRRASDDYRAHMAGREDGLNANTGDRGEVAA